MEAGAFCSDTRFHILEKFFYTDNRLALEQIQCEPTTGARQQAP